MGFIAALAIGGGVGAATGAFIWSRVALEEFAESEASAPDKLLPGSGVSPELPHYATDRIRNSQFFIYFGNQIACADTFPFMIISQKGEPMLRLDRNGNELLLSAKFFNKDGKIVCEIENNRFHPNDRFLFRIDRPSENKLSVYDDEARRVLEVEYINTRTVRIDGRYYLRDKVEMVLDPAHVVFQSEWSSVGLMKNAIFWSDPGGSAIELDFSADSSEKPNVTFAHGLFAHEKMLIIKNEPIIPPL